MKTKLKQCIPTLWKMKIKSILSKSDKYAFLNKEDKKIVVALAADYANLGDVAITVAQKKFFQENFKEYKIVEFLCKDTVKNMKSLKKKINKQDIITIVGGGNMGNVYLGIEEQRRFIIQNFKHNSIISFPQTIDFTEDDNGKKEKEKTKKIYNRHPNMMVLAREKKTYNTMENIFDKCVVEESPDIVLYLNGRYPIRQRNNTIIWCMRNDKEKVIEETYKESIYQALLSKGETIEHHDTHIGEIEVEHREKSLEDIWNTFAEAKLVVTDRLHGMIFCVLTHSPCIVFNNSNGKVKEVYERWLKNVEFIKLMQTNTQEEFMQKYAEFEMGKENKEVSFQNDFKELKNKIDRFLNHL